MCIRDRGLARKIADVAERTRTNKILPDELSGLSLIHISEPTRLLSISYAVFCFKMIRPPPRSTRVRSSAASDVYKRQGLGPQDRGRRRAYSHQQDPP